MCDIIKKIKYFTIKYKGENKMDDLIFIMNEMLEELRDINRKLDEIQGNSINNSISDICDKLDIIDLSIDAISK